MSGRDDASESAAFDDAGVDPGTPLELTPDICTRIDQDGHVLVDSPVGTVIDAGPQGFAILSLFSGPLSLQEAVERLDGVLLGQTAFWPALKVINGFIETGVLTGPEARGRPTLGWADPVEHARMLHDERRTGDYLAAIAQGVRPGDVVIDIGTGSGVLAVAAARAGARHVYALEATDIAATAAEVFVANGLQDQITVIPGWSMTVDVPEPADLLVSEIIGSEPLEEGILEVTLDARRRMLKPGGRLIPGSLTLLVRPLLIPEAEIRERTIGSSAVRHWREQYGIDFQPLLDSSGTELIHEPEAGELVGTWPCVGAPVELASFDLGAFESTSVSASTDLVLDTGRVTNAVALTFRADLHGTVSHTLDPWRWPSSSWATSVWMLPEPLQVRSGALLRVHYRHGVRGHADGLTCEVVDPVRG